MKYSIKYFLTGRATRNFEPMEKDNLISILTGDAPGDAASAVRLQSIIKNHPWFGLPYYALLKLNEFPGDFNKENLTGKALLHFAHPFLLHYQLTNTPSAITTVQPGQLVEENKALHNPGPGENILQAEPAPEQPEELAGGDDDKNIEITESGNAEIEILQASTENTTGEVNEENKPGEQPPAEKDELLFEPLYTTDYFASQGIKLSEQVISQDKLGRQMKSFTEWLKSMKKVNAEAGEPGNEKSESQVQVLAEKSNREADVITESMAEVFIEQGQIEKARNIYEKLSLLNPAKIAYFAAKSEKLKRTE